MSKVVRGEARARGSARWPLVAVAVLLVLAAGFLFWRTRAVAPFRILEGDQQVLVLLRNRHDGHYTLQYTGKRPVELRTFKVMLAGEVLHMDVDAVVLRHDGREYAVEAGKVMGDSPLVLQSGDTLEVVVTYHGQTLGSNYVYGFRFGYDENGRERMYDLTLGFEYGVFVE